MNGFVPSYFISEDNLLKGSIETREKIIQIIRSLLDTTPIYLTKIKCDSVGLFLQYGVADTVSKTEVKEISADIKIKFEASQHELDRFIYKLHKWTLDYIIQCAKEFIIFAADESLDTCIKLHNDIIYEMEMDSDRRLILEHKHLERRMASEYILPFLFTSLGSQMFVKHLFANIDVEKAHMLSQSFEILTKGLDSDSMSGHLKLAAVLFKLGRISDSKELLDTIDENFNPQITTTHCGCSKNSDYVCESLRNKIRNDKLSTLEILRQYIGVCVWFLRTEVDLVPKDLHYEMFRSVFSQTPRKPHVDDWFDCAAVDADVFLFYMQYKVNQELGNSHAMEIAQMSLLLLMEQNVNLAHVDTAHNLLGCLQNEKGDVEGAWRCFLALWALRPDHNAAKWHMAIILFEATKNQNGDVGSFQNGDNGEEILYSRL